MGVDCIKLIIKKFVEYHIEGDYQVYTLKHTSFCIRRLMTAKYNRKWAKLPVNHNKIIFDNYMGGSYGCNGKYITEELLRQAPEAEIVWTVKNAKKRRAEFPEQVRLVEYLSDDTMYEYATAGVWVCNIHMVPYMFKGLRKKREQHFIQTWHGSLGIKKIENDSPLIKKAQNWLKMAELSSSFTDYWISNSQFETDVYKSAFWNVRNILEYGHPRNDIFFTENEGAAEKVRQYLGIHADVKTVLYVPTYREGENTEHLELDYQGTINAFKKRYGGEWKLLIRIHPKMRDKAAQIVPQTDQIVDVSAYPDIQELMVYVDAMITDYSSAIFDFVLTYKPGFIFAVDEHGYDTERGLYYPLSKTPFPVAENNQELEQNILNFDAETYSRNVTRFLKEKGCIDDGNAAKRTAELILTLIDNSRDHM